jgi:hypothetical protein
MFNCFEGILYQICNKERMFKERLIASEKKRSFEGNAEC